MTRCYLLGVVITATLVACGGPEPSGAETSGGFAHGGSATGGASGFAGGAGTTALGGRAPTAGSAGTAGIASLGGAAGSGQASAGNAAEGGTSGGVATGGTGGSSASGGSAPGGPTCGTGAPVSSDVVINLGSLQQKITGFGVSSAWSGSYRNASDADYLWSPTKGAGLTLLRIRYGDGLTIAKSAASFGVTVWMTPWGMGNNGAQGGPYTTQQSNPNGCTGSMPVLSDPEGWASALSSYVQNLKNQGVQLYAVSAENEPDSCGINATTSYSAKQLATWITYLGPAMKPLGVKVMGPETQNACGFANYFTAIKSDSAAWDAVDIFASHEYGCGTLPTQTSIAAAGKEYWETEVDTGRANGDSTGDGIASALLMATTIHNDLTKANLNAWHHWWVYNASGNGGCLYDTTTNVWTKRLWVLGNFSRFVRPGFKRVSTSGTLPSGVFVSAYFNEADGSVAIVAINSGSSAAKLPLFMMGPAPCMMTPHVTSATDNLAAKSAVGVSASRFTAELAPQSVTTFVGKP